MASSFALSKWYMDCVGEDGEAVIAYAAELRYRALALHYTSVLHHTGAGARTSTRSTLRRAMPVLTSAKVGASRSTLTWASEALGTRGSWDSDAPELTATVFASPGGSVEWRCAMPTANAAVHLDHGRILTGRGYAEHVTLTIAPWELPLRELRWGRFTSAQGSVVWIDWVGEHSARFVFVDGVRCDARVTEREVVFDGGHLALHDPVVLRDGAIGKTALTILADVLPLPGNFLATDETKWVCRGTLHRGGVQAHRPKGVGCLRAFCTEAPGWAIHEVVRWG